MDDVGIGFADLRCNARQYAPLVLYQDEDATIETAVQVGAPDHFDPAIRFLRALALCKLTIGTVHHQSLVALELTDDAIARNRLATGCQIYEHAFAAIDRHWIEPAAAGAASRTGIDHRAGRGFAFGQPKYMTRYQSSHAFADTDVCVQVVKRLGTRFIQQTLGQWLRQRRIDIERAQCLRQQALAQFD